MVTDEDGRVTSRRDYTAFSEESVAPERDPDLGYSGQSETRTGYTGYEKDAESGLDFAQARYYNPTHGRFTSVDPLTASATIRNPQTFNRYAYVLNSPYKFTDPLGLIPVTTGACGNSCPNSGPTVDGSSFRGRDASFDWAVFTDAGVASAHASAHDRELQSEPPAPPPAATGIPRIRFERIEVNDVFNGDPVSVTEPPIYGDANRPVTVDLGYDPREGTFIVRVYVSVEGDRQIVESTNPERPDIFNTRVEANTTADVESNTRVGRGFDLAPLPASDPPRSQTLDVSESGKTATITFAARIKNDNLRTNSFTVTVYGVSNRIFGPNGKINTQNTFRGTLKIKFALPQSEPPRNLYLKKPPF